MTDQELETYLQALGWQIARVEAVSPGYLIIREYQIQTGSLAGHTCDIAIAQSSAVPYVLASAIHTRPALVARDVPRYHTQSSPLGPDWQYWSRVLGGQPTPQRIVAHLATIFSEV